MLVKSNIIMNHANNTNVVVKTFKTIYCEYTTFEKQEISHFVLYILKNNTVPEVLIEQSGSNEVN